MLSDFKELSMPIDYLGLFGQLGISKIEDLVYAGEIIKGYIKQESLPELNIILQRIIHKCKDELDKIKNSRIEKMIKFHDERDRARMNKITPSKEQIHKEMTLLIEICGLEDKNINLSSMESIFEKIISKEEKEIAYEIYKTLKLDRISILKLLDYSGHFEKMYSELHAICIGIDEYDKLPRLEGSLDGARSFANTLTNIGFKVDTLYGNDATSLGIGKMLGELRQRLDHSKNSDSLVVIYFSGHTFSKGESHQLCPRNFDVNNVVETGQNLLNLKNRILTTFPCKHVLIIFDCVFAGDFFDQPHTKVAEFENKRTFYSCNMMQKSMWALSSGQKTKKRGEIARDIETIFLNKKEQNGGVPLDLFELFEELKKVNEICQMGALSGSPIEFGVPMIPLSSIPFKLYLTKREKTEAKRISEMQSKRCERFQKVHVAKHITLKEMKDEMQLYRKENVKCTEFDWRIVKEGNEIEALNILDEFTNKNRISENFVVAIDGERGSGKSTLAKYLGVQMPNEKFLEFIFTVDLNKRVMEEGGDCFKTIEHFYDYVFSNSIKRSVLENEDRLKIREILQERESAGKILWIIDGNIITQELQEFLIKHLKKIIFVTVFSTIKIPINKHYTLYGVSLLVKKTMKERYPQHSLLFNHPQFSEVLLLPVNLDLFCKNVEKTNYQILEIICDALLIKSTNPNDDPREINDLLERLAFIQFKSKSTLSQSQILEQIIICGIKEKASNVLFRLTHNGVLRMKKSSEFTFSYSMISDFFLSKLGGRVLNIEHLGGLDKRTAKILDFFEDKDNIAICGKKNDSLPYFLCHLIKSEIHIMDIFEAINKTNIKPHKKFLSISTCLDFAPLEFSLRYLTNLLQRQEQQEQQLNNNSSPSSQLHKMLKGIFECFSAMGVKLELIEFFLIRTKLDPKESFLLAAKNTNMLIFHRLLQKINFSEKEEEMILEILKIDFGLIQFIPKKEIKKNQNFFSVLIKSKAGEKLSTFRQFYKSKQDEILDSYIFLTASVFGRLEIMKDVYNSNINVNQMLISVANSTHHCDIEIFKYLIQTCGANAFNQALSQFIRKENTKSLEVVKYLVERGADVNFRDKNSNRSILEYACCNSQMKIIVFLIENGAKDLQSAYNIASLEGRLNEELQKYLEGNGCLDQKNIIINDKRGGRSSIATDIIDEEYVTERGSALDVLYKECCKYIPNINEIREQLEIFSIPEIQTVLFRLFARKSRIQTGVLRTFFNKHAFYLEKDVNERSLLYTCCANGNMEAFVVLLEYCNIVDIRDIMNGINDCNDPSAVGNMMDFIEHNKFFGFEMAEDSLLKLFNSLKYDRLKRYLIKREDTRLYGIFRNTEELSKRDPLDKDDYLRLFSYNKSDQYGRIPLLHYCENKIISLPFLEFLLRITTSTCSIDNKGKNALHIACQNKNVDVDVVKRLIRASKDLIMKDANGKYPVFYAIQNIRVDIFQLFSEYCPSSSFANNESLELAKMDEEVKLCWYCEIDKSFSPEIHKYKSAVFYAAKNSSIQNERIIFEGLIHTREALMGALKGDKLKMVERLIEMGVQYAKDDEQEVDSFVRFCNIKSGYEQRRNYLMILNDHLSKRTFHCRNTLPKYPAILIDLYEEEEQEKERKNPYSKIMKTLFKKARMQRDFTTKDFKRIEIIIKSALQKITKDFKNKPKVSLLAINCKLRYHGDEIQIYVGDNDGWASFNVFYKFIRELQPQSMILNVFEFAGEENMIKEKEVDNFKMVCVNTILNKCTTFKERICGIQLFMNVINFNLFENLCFEKSFIKSISKSCSAVYLKKNEEIYNVIALAPKRFDKNFIFVNLSKEKISNTLIGKLSNGITNRKIINSLQDLEKEKNVWVVVVFFNENNDRVEVINAPRKDIVIEVRGEENEIFLPSSSSSSSLLSLNNGDGENIAKKTYTFAEIKEVLKKIQPAAVFAMDINRIEMANDVTTFKKEKILDFTDFLCYNRVYREVHKHFSFLTFVFERMKTYAVSFECAMMEYFLREKKYKSTAPQVKYSYVQKSIEDFESTVDHLSLGGFDQKHRLTNGNPYVLGIINGDARKIKMLVQSQCPGINGNDNSGRTPLIISVLKDCFGISTILLTSKEIDVNAIDPISGNTALHICAAKYQDTIINILLEKKSKLNVLNYNFSSALHFGFKYGTITTDSQEKIRAQQICTVLIQKGADPMKDYYGEVNQFLYKNVWMKKEPLFIDWFERVISQRDKSSPLKNFLLFASKKFNTIQNFPEEKSNNESLSHSSSTFLCGRRRRRRYERSDRVLIINCTDRKKSQDDEVLDLILGKVGIFFKELQYVEVDFCSSIDDMKRVVKLHGCNYKLAFYFGGYDHELDCFTFPVKDSEKFEKLSFQDFSLVLSNIKCVLLNVVNCVDKDVLGIHKRNTTFKYLISNMRSVSEFENFYYIEYLLRGLFIFHDKTQRAIKRAQAFIIQQDITTNVIHSFHYSTKRDNLVANKQPRHLFEEDDKHF